MDDHVDAGRVSLHVDIEHVYHTISVKVSKVEQVVNLLRHFLSRNQAERVEAFKGLTARISFIFG